MTQFVTNSFNSYSSDISADFPSVSNMDVSLVGDIPSSFKVENEFPRPGDRLVLEMDVLENECQIEVTNPVQDFRNKYSSVELISVN